MLLGGGGGGEYSEWKGITAGVPQGSVLGPLLFLICINDMVDDVQSEALLYADDSMLLDIVASPADSAKKINLGWPIVQYKQRVVL